MRQRQSILFATAFGRVASWLLLKLRCGVGCNGVTCGRIAFIGAAGRFDASFWGSMANSRDAPSSGNEANRLPKLDSPDEGGLGLPDDRSAAAKAAAWASRIMTISLEMVVPGLVGYWLDTKLGTKFILMLAGFVLGFTAAIKHLLHLTQKK